MLIPMKTEVRDMITGFQGAVTAQITYLIGGKSYLVQPKSEDSSVYKEGTWFQEERLLIVKNKIIKTKKVKTK
jgi:hypothetical protein